MLNLIFLVIGIASGVSFMKIYTTKQIDTLAHDCGKAEERAATNFNRLQALENVLLEADTKNESYYETLKKVKATLNSRSKEI